MTMTHASLFSGIGGFDLAAEWAGWTNSFNCEIDPFCRRILKYHFPNAEQYADIRTTDFTIWRGRVDVLTGGFPCQPFSLAGKRKGTEDDRYLWPEMLRVIRTVRPRWIVGENVFGIVNWSEGVVFEQVCSDLEAAGYAVQPYIIPACGVGAPHRRDRCWFVGHLVENPVCVRRDNDNPKEEPRTGQFGMPCAGDHVRICGTKGIAAHRSDAGVETMQERQDGVHAVELVANASRFEDNRRRSRGFFAKPTGLMPKGMLPTPTARDFQPPVSLAALMRRNGAMRTDALCNIPVMIGEHCTQRHGKTSQLNPLFVAEMMGFPVDWTVLPFLNGETCPSKPTETPSCLK